MLSSLSSVCFQVWEAQICYDPCISRWYSSKESSCQCRKHKRHGFDPWVGKSPWRRKWQSTPVFLPGEFHGERSLVGYKESDTIEWLSTQQHTQSNFTGARHVSEESDDSSPRPHLSATAWGTSLVVQWLGVCLPVWGTQVRFLVQEDPTCCSSCA